MRELHARDPGAAGDIPVAQDTRAAVVDALAAVGLPDDRADSVLRAMDVRANGVVTPFSGSDDLLRTIKDELGLACVLVSNATYRTSRAYRRDFDSFALGGFIDGIVSSVDLGYRKPHEIIFRAAADQARVAPGACVMIGDSEDKDIAPAVRLGMRTIRVAIEVPRPDRGAADLVATSLFEAAEGLRSVVKQ